MGNENNKKINCDEISNLKLIIDKKDAEILQLKKIIDFVPGDIYWKDTNGVYLGMNLRGRESLRKMGLHWRLKDIVGKKDYEIFGKKSAEEYRKNDIEVMKKGSEISKEEIIFLPSGSIMIQLSTKQPLRNEQGEIIGVVGNTVDITYLKEMEKDLRTAKERAEKVREAEDELKKVKYQLEGAKLISGSIAHEIRTPLATIKSGMHGLNNTISKLIKVNELAQKENIIIDTVTHKEIMSMKKAIHLINKKVDQSNVIINMLLTKLQSIHFEFKEFSACSAVPCIQNAIKEFMIPDNIIDKIHFNKENDFQFLGNSTLIRHVIMNLLKNAIFYILKAAKGEITIWLEHHSKTNEIHFKDTGTGISPEVFPHIFDSFFTTESSIGTGIGLAFSKMVMQSHHGDINCISKEGEYTEFVLSFPKFDNQKLNEYNLHI